MSAALAIFQVPLITAVTMWFHKHLGVAMGLLQSAQGLANLLFAPLMVVLLTQLGWRWAFWGPGIVGGLLLLGLIRYFHEPAEVGLRPLGPIRKPLSGPCRKARSPACAPPSFSNRPGAPLPFGTSLVFTTGGALDTPSLSSIWRTSFEHKDCPSPRAL